MVLRLSLLAMLFIALVLVLVTQPASAQKQNPAADVEVLKDIVTGKGGEKAMHLTMYRLKAKQDKPMPAVVWIHGGGWMQGSYNDTQSRHLALAARGYVVASIEHRFSGEAVFPAAIEDCKLAVRPPARSCQGIQHRRGPRRHHRRLVGGPSRRAARHVWLDQGIGREGWLARPIEQSASRRGLCRHDRAHSLWVRQRQGHDDQIPRRPRHGQEGPGRVGQPAHARQQRFAPLPHHPWRQ